MKKIRLILLLLSSVLLSGNLLAQDPEVSFQFTPLKLTGHEYAPRHVIAVWVTTEDGTFVNSLLVYAGERIAYLSKWSASSKNRKADAVTAATQSTQKTHTATWNRQTYVGTTAEAGNYIMCFEMSSGEKGNANPYYEFPFTLGDNGFALPQTPQTYLTDITLSYFNGQNTSVNDVKKAQSVSIYPNPATPSSVIKLEGFEDGLYNCSVSDLSGRSIYTSVLTFNANEKTLELSKFMKGSENGMYVLQLQRGEVSITKSFIYNE